MFKCLCDMFVENGVFYVEVFDIVDDVVWKLKGKFFYFGYIFNFNFFILWLVVGFVGFVEVFVMVGCCVGIMGVFFMCLFGIVIFDVVVMKCEVDVMCEVMMCYYFNVVL